MAAKRRAGFWHGEMLQCFTATLQNSVLLHQMACDLFHAVLVFSIACGSSHLMPMSGRPPWLCYINRLEDKGFIDQCLCLLTTHINPFVHYPSTRLFLFQGIVEQMTRKHTVLGYYPSNVYTDCSQQLLL